MPAMTVCLLLRARMARIRSRICAACSNRSASASASISAGLWKGKGVTGLSVSISFEGLTNYEETEGGFKTLLNAWKTGQPIEVVALERENADPYLTGSFVIEKIFAIPGMGGYFVNSVTQRDYTTIMGMTVFYAAFLIAMVFIVDLFYCLIDPRIKFD
jgi:hypothetical protein